MINLKFHRKHIIRFLAIVAGAGLLFIFVAFFTETSFDTVQTTKIYDRNGTLIYENIGDFGRKRNVAYDELPDNLINAVVAAEDETFWKNPGFDLMAIIRAVKQNFESRKIVTGASTITQQVARITFENSYELPPVVRKLREIGTSIKLTFGYSKKQIIEKYLNEVYFGNLNYGIGAASNYYFNKNVTNLSLGESAFLIGIISSPQKYDPLNNFESAKQRQEYVLNQMHKNGYIGKELAEQTAGEPIGLTIQEQELVAPHFRDYVLKQVNDLNISAAHGLNIYTTLDINMFKMAENISKYRVSELSRAHNLSNAAVVVIENKTGKVPVMMGGVDYLDYASDGAVNMTTAVRQPGSAIKPLTYALAFQNGYSPASLILDEQKAYLTKTGEGFTPRNYDNKFHGYLSFREALASSLNMPAVEILSRVGIRNFIDLGKRMGISTFQREDDYDLAITLGGGEVKLIELANLYSVFANYGEYIPFYTIEKVTDTNNNLLYSHKESTPEQVLGDYGKQIAFLITDILSDQKARMLGFREKNPLVLTKTAAVKTGTTTDWHDVWTIGYTKDYTVGVWVGNNNNDPMKEISGVTGAAPIWNQIFEDILNSYPYTKFDQSAGIEEKQVCLQYKNELCVKQVTDLFITGLAKIESAEKNIQITAIIEPLEKARYQLAPNLLDNPKIEFKASVPENAKYILWYLNGKLLDKVAYPATSYFWEPEEGAFALSTVTVLQTGENIGSGTVNFTVVTYRAGMDDN